MEVSSSQLNSNSPKFSIPKLSSYDKYLVSGPTGGRSID